MYMCITVMMLWDGCVTESVFLNLYQKHHHHPVMHYGGGAGVSTCQITQKTRRDDPTARFRLVL